MESQPQNLEFRISPENFHPWGCGNTMPDLSYLVPFHSGQVRNFCLLVLGQVFIKKGYEIL